MIVANIDLFSRALIAIFFIVIIGFGFFSALLFSRGRFVTHLSIVSISSCIFKDRN